MPGRIDSRTPTPTPTLTPTLTLTLALTLTPTLTLTLTRCRIDSVKAIIAYAGSSADTKNLADTRNLAGTKNRAGTKSLADTINLLHRANTKSLAAEEVPEAVKHLVNLTEKSNGVTPLFRAAQNGHVPVIEALLAGGG